MNSTFDNCSTNGAKENEYNKSSQYDLSCSGIDEELFQQVVSKLKCSYEQEEQTIVPPIQYSQDDEFHDMLETFSSSNSISMWLFWIIVILVVVLIVLFFVYQPSILSSEIIHSTMNYYQYN